MSFSDKRDRIWSSYDIKETAQIIQFVFFILMPIACLFGIVANLLVTITVTYKSNEKDLKENQYKYMGLNACSNILILSFQMISLTTECQYNENFGIFCSRIRKFMFFQFYRILFIEYLTHVLNLISNLSYICYSINRLSLIGQEHGKFVTNVSKMKIKKFIKITFGFCLVLPVSKIFTFRPNYFKPEHNYPDFFESNFSEKISALIIVYLAANIIYNLINSVGFMIANLVVDINLLMSMKKVLAEREKNKSRAVQANESQKK